MSNQQILERAIYPTTKRPTIRLPWKYLIAIILVSFLSLPLHGKTPPHLGADPQINQPYINPEFNQWVNIFESPGREIYDQRFELLKNLRLSSGMTVADIGAGTGLLTWLMAEEVGEKGKVFAVDVSRVFIDNIKRIAEEKQLQNIETVLNDQRSARLPADSISLAVMVDTYHHFEFPIAMMHSIHQALKPDGEIVIVDFRRHPDISSPWVMGHVRAGREAVIEEVKAMGFELVESLDFLKVNFYLRFRKVSQ